MTGHWYPAGYCRTRSETHHNVGGLPARMKMKLIEPLRELFREIAARGYEGFRLSGAEA